MAKYKRRNKLIKPGLQLQLSLTFVGLCALGLVMQALLFISQISKLTAILPNDGSLLMSVMSDTLTQIFMASALVFLPLTLVVGILMTFRVAGPAYRMEMYLRELARDGYRGPCRIRKGDRLQELCDALNEAVESLAEQIPEPESGEVQGDAPSEHHERDEPKAA